MGWVYNLLISIHQYLIYHFSLEMQHEKTKQSKNATDREADQPLSSRLRKDSLSSAQVPAPDVSASKAAQPAKELD